MSSPTLHLSIGSSAISQRMALLHVIVYVTALVQVCLNGYPTLALALLCGYLLCFGRAFTASPRGTEILWQAGQWKVGVAGVEQDVVLQRGYCTPWITCFAWREASGHSRVLFLFNDCAERDALRRLRVRLQLERRV